MVLQPIWYQDVPLSRLSVYQISRQLDNVFVLYNNFHTLTKRKRKIKKTKKLSQFSKVHISETPGTIQLNWNWIVRWWHCLAFSLQKLFCFVKVSRSYLYVKIAFLFFSVLLITHECGAPASWAHDTLPCIYFFISLSWLALQWLGLQHNAHWVWEKAA